MGQRGGWRGRGRQEVLRHEICSGLSHCTARGSLQSVGDCWHFGGFVDQREKGGGVSRSGRAETTLGLKQSNVLKKMKNQRKSKYIYIYINKSLVTDSFL